MDITGHTKLIPIVGDPVAGVVSPPLFNAKFSELGIDARMVPFCVPSDGLQAFWQLLRRSETFIGCSVTYPHKQAAFHAADRVSDRAKRLGAVNTLHRNADGTLFGDATDGAALVQAIQDAGFDLNGRTAHVIGAGGGAGRAIVDAFCAAGVRAVRIEDVCRSRCAEAAEMIKTAWPSVARTTAACDLIVDATANGKSARQAQLFSASEIAAAVMVCDIAGTHTTSRLLIQAAADGKQTVDAADMGAGHVGAQLAIWLPEQSRAASD